MEHFWSPVNAPVLGADGDVVLIVHRVEEVTELMRATAAPAAVETAYDRHPLLLRRLQPAAGGAGSRLDAPDALPPRLRRRYRAAQHGG